MRCCKLLLFLPVLLLACGPKETNRKICTYQVADPVLQVYNDVLTELVEQHFYNEYLGEEKEAVSKEWEKLKTPDSAAYRLFIQKFNALHNKLYGDSSRFRTIYFTNQEHFSNSISERLPSEIFTSDSSNIGLFLKRYNAQNDSSIRVLTKSQHTYMADDFRGCTFKVASLGSADSYLELRGEERMQAIGQVAFSEIIWSGKETGILYYEFFCCSKLGKGEIVCFRKVNGRWEIKETVQLWIA